MLIKWLFLLFKAFKSKVIHQKTSDPSDVYGEKTSLYFDQFKKDAKQFKRGKPGEVIYYHKQEIEAVLKDIAHYPNRPIGMIVEHVNPHLIAVLILRTPFERSYVKFFSDKALLAVVAVAKEQKGLSALFRMSELDPDFKYLINGLSAEILLKKRIDSICDTTKPPREFQVLYQEDGTLQINQVPHGHIKFPKTEVGYLKFTKLPIH